MSIQIPHQESLASDRKLTLGMNKIVRKLPDWVPGTGFKKTGRQWRAELKAVAEIPYTFVKNQMAQDKHDASFTSRLIEVEGSDPETNKWSALSIYAAGIDTVSSPSPFISPKTLTDKF